MSDAATYILALTHDELRAIRETLSHADHAFPSRHTAHALLVARSATETTDTATWEAYRYGSEVPA